MKTKSTDARREALRRFCDVAAAQGSPMAQTTMDVIDDLEAALAELRASERRPAKSARARGGEVRP